MQTAETVKRIRAARNYAGFSQAELADKVGLGADVVKRIESSKREAKQMELDAIAKACDLPSEWFTVNFYRLKEIAFEGQPPSREIAEISKVTEILESRVNRLASNDERFSPLRSELQNLSRRLDELKQ